MNIQRALVALVFGMGLSVGAAEASTFACDASVAATNGGGTLGVGSTVAFSTNPVRAFACFGGNDTNSIRADFVLFGQTGWLLADKNDDAVSGDGKLQFQTPPRNGRNSGTFTMFNPLGLREVVVTLKAGPGFAAALLDGVVLDGRTLSWLTRRELSHASIYYRPQAPSPLPPVPLPAGLVLLPSALAGMLLWRLRRRAGPRDREVRHRSGAATA